MRIKKIPMNGYEARLYKTKKYTSLYASFVFELEYTKENIYLCDLLAEYMLNTNKVYKTKKEIFKYIRTYYDMYMGINNFNIGKKLFIEVSFSFLDPTLVKDEYLENAIHFAYDNLFKPNFTDGKLDKEILDTCKSKMISAKGIRLKNSDTRASISFARIYLSNTYLTTDLIETKEEYEQLLNSFSDKDIIDMHKLLINNCFVGCNLMGNYRDSDIDLIKKLFVFKNVKQLDSEYEEKIDFNYENRNVTISDDNISESTLIAIYSIDKYKKGDLYTYIAISCALNYVGMVLHKVLREEMHLVYNASASYNTKAHFFTIKAYIDKNNKDKTLEGFKKVLKKLEDRDYVSEILEKGKREVKLQNYIEDESAGRLFDRMVDESYKWSESKDIRTKAFMDITEDDIINAVKRLKCEGVFFYRGDKNE